jgi:hypothetical protein
VFIARLFEERGETNVFHAFYRALVQELFDAGVRATSTASTSMRSSPRCCSKMLWKPLHAGEIGERDLETAAFTIFLYPRMLGCAAEIDDHLNRGRNMDTRTAASVLQVRRLIGGARITNPGRNAHVFDVPTLKEQGYDVHAGGFRGFVAPAGVSREVVALWETTLSKVHKSAGWQIT